MKCYTYSVSFQANCVRKIMLAINYSKGKVNKLDVSKPKGEGVLVNISTCGICAVSYTHLTLPTKA